MLSEILQDIIRHPQLNDSQKDDNSFSLLFSVDYGSFQLHGRAVPVDIHMSFLNKYHSYRFLPFLGKSAN